MRGHAAALSILLVLLAAPVTVLAESGTAASVSPFNEQEALAFSQSVIGKPVGEYFFVDREGRQVHLAQYRGKPLLVSFIYTGCFQVCPITTKFLAKAVSAASDALGAGSFNVVSIGFNLPFDTPSAMRTFAKQQSVGAKNWEFLTPDPETLGQLTKDFGFLYYPSPKGYDHLIQVTLVDPQGRVYRQIYGDAFEFPMLVTPMRELVTGAPTPANDVSAFIERLRILCTVYDPTSGKYRLNYALFIELLVGVTIIGAVLFTLLSEWRKHKRAARRTPLRDADAPGSG